MRTAAYYLEHSYCWGKPGPQHDGKPVVSLGGELVGHICGTCFDAVRQVRRGSPLWIREEEEA